MSRAGRRLAEWLLASVLVDCIAGLLECIVSGVLDSLTAGLLEELDRSGASGVQPGLRPAWQRLMGAKCMDWSTQEGRVMCWGVGGGDCGRQCSLQSAIAESEELEDRLSGVQGEF